MKSIDFNNLSKRFDIIDYLCAFKSNLISTNLVQYGNDLDEETKEKRGELSKMNVFFSNCK